MSPGTGVVRPAAVDDAAGIARAHVQVWRETYTGLMPADLLTGLDVDRSTRSWRSRLSAPDPGRAGSSPRPAEEPTARTRVAEADGEVVGFASAGPGRDDDRPVALELIALNLLRSHHASGLGQRLLDAAVGDQPAYLWVADPNPRAQAFYSRNGFRRDGTEKVDETLRVREVRMVRTPLVGTPVTISVTTGEGSPAR